MSASPTLSQEILDLAREEAEETKGLQAGEGGDAGVSAPSSGPPQPTSISVDVTELQRALEESGLVPVTRETFDRESRLSTSESKGTRISIQEEQEGKKGKRKRPLFLEHHSGDGSGKAQMQKKHRRTNNTGSTHRKSGSDSDKVVNEELRITYTPIDRATVKSREEWNRHIINQRFIILLLLSTLGLPRETQARFFCHNPYFSSPWKRLNEQSHFATLLQLGHSRRCKSFEKNFKYMPHYRHDILSPEERCSACGLIHENVVIRLGVELWGGEYCPETLIEYGKQRSCSMTLGSVCFPRLMHRHAAQHAVFQLYHRFAKHKYHPYLRSLGRDGLKRFYQAGTDIVDVDEFMRVFHASDPQLKEQPVLDMELRLKKICDRRLHPEQTSHVLDQGRERVYDEDDTQRDGEGHEKSFDGVRNSQEV